MRENRRDFIEQSRRSRRLLASTLIGLLCLLAPALVAQEAQYSADVTVEEVRLDVRVTDSRGNLILGLGPDDFLIEEDGEPVEIRDVTFYSNRDYLETRRSQGSLGIDPSNVATQRYFVLFFHDQRRILPRLAAQQLDAGRRAQQWTRSQLQPNDWVAVVSYFPQLRVQDFTNDPEAIAAGIDAAVTGAAFDPSFQQPADAPSMAEYVPDLEPLDPDIYGALQAISEAAAHIPGRKNLVFFSLGFGEVNSFGLYMPDTRYMPDTLHRLNDANIAVYAVDLIPSSNGMFSRLGAYESSLSQLASATGGEFYFNFVNFIQPLEQISEHTNGYYLVAYERPTDETGYQEVEVDTTNPNFRAEARGGYIAGS